MVNATGAWVDRTWQGLDVPAPCMMAGTKGSHCFTFHAGLRAALAGRGLYAEAADGRPIFVTPLGDTTLIGTTDEPFEADPATAVAREDEVDYLLQAVNAIMPDVGLKRSDVAFSYCGVRPLPYVAAASTAAVTRRHWVDESIVQGVPCYSIIGGKLTTCRSLAEQATVQILGNLKIPVRTTSQDRTIPGGEDYPADEGQLHAAWATLAGELNLPPAAIEAVWWLYGTRCWPVLTEALALAAEYRSQHGYSFAADALIPDTSLPAALVLWIVHNEWVTTLDDLVERRLMLLYDQRLLCRSLLALAEIMAAAGRLRASPGAAAAAVQATAVRLRQHFGKQIDD